MSDCTACFDLYLQIVGGGGEEELDRHQRSMQREVNEVDGVTGVGQIPAGKAAENAWAIDLGVIGCLAVALRQACAFDVVVSGNRRKEKRRVGIKWPDATVLQFDAYSLKEVLGLGGARCIDSNA